MYTMQWDMFESTSIVFFGPWNLRHGFSGGKDLVPGGKRKDEGTAAEAHGAPTAGGAAGGPKGWS